MWTGDNSKISKGNRIIPRSKCFIKEKILLQVWGRNVALVKSSKMTFVLPFLFELNASQRSEKMFTSGVVPPNPIFVLIFPEGIIGSLQRNSISRSSYFFKRDKHLKASWLFSLEGWKWLNNNLFFSQNSGYSQEKKSWKRSKPSLEEI